MPTEGTGHFRISEDPTGNRTRDLPSRGAVPRIFQLSIQTFSGPTQTRMRCVPGYLGAKRPRREVGHSTLSSAEVKNEWCYTATSLYAFTAWTETTLPLRFLLNGGYFTVIVCNFMYLQLFYFTHMLA